MSPWLLLLLCGTAISALSHDDSSDSAVLDKFSAGDSKINFDHLVSADAMDQLKDTLKEIEGSVDTALDQRRDAKTASDNKASELESSVTSLESAKSVVEVEVEELKSENAELKDTKRKLEDQLDSLKDKVSQMQTKIDQLEATAAPTAAPKKEDAKEDSMRNNMEQEQCVMKNCPYNDKEQEQCVMKNCPQVRSEEKRDYQRDDPQFTRFKGHNCKSCTDDQCSQCYDLKAMPNGNMEQQQCVMKNCRQVQSEESQEEKKP